MGFIWYIIIGIVAGFLAGKVMRGGGFGLIINLLLGSPEAASPKRANTQPPSTPPRIPNNTSWHSCHGVFSFHFASFASLFYRCLALFQVFQFVI
jgi:hypothetical protein